MSTIVVSLLSFTGVFMLSLKAASLRKLLTYLICFAVGALLGNVFFHLIPEIFEHTHGDLTNAWLCILSFLAFFVIDQLLHVHQKTDTPIESYGYLSLYTDAVHNFTDGILIGAAWMVSPEMGFATTLAIVLHEIPQEISDFAVLIKAGFSRNNALLFNFIAACSAILGTVLTLLMGHHIRPLSTCILPVAAGGFIYLAAASLLPEVLRESTKKNLLLFLPVILAGIALMYIFTIYGGHTHTH
jgi:zinc and cadmium transporter